MIKILLVDHFDFELPSSLIAYRPVKPPSSSRMLVLDGNTCRDSSAYQLPNWLSCGDVLIFNDTRVLPSCLYAEIIGRIRNVDIMLIREISLNFWIARIYPASKVSSGDILNLPGNIRATITEKGDWGEVKLMLEAEDNKPVDVFLYLKTYGSMPLPPYITKHRRSDSQDIQDYQTVFASRDGAIAAPTAALHFDDALLAALDARGIITAPVTLHVGEGTFLPVRASNTHDHVMHAEWGEITPQTAQIVNDAHKRGDRVIAIGTTSLRVLETATTDSGEIQSWLGMTDIFITPSYSFKCIDGIISNLHPPRSTPFMLVCAFMGVDYMQKAYAHAIREKYRFCSYGDASLLLRDMQHNLAL
jgi:S-adenosylmethionine:tRNA ribosyltransferase-isomerase